MKAKIMNKQELFLDDVCNHEKKNTNWDEFSSEVKFIEKSCFMRLSNKNFKVKAGSLLNILGVAIVTLFINTYGIVYFGLDEFPDWAKPVNTTTS